MKKFFRVLLFLIIIFLFYSSAILYAASTNSYKDYKLQDTKKIMILFFETKNHKIHESERFKIKNTDAPK